MVPPNLSHCDYATTVEFATMVPERKKKWLLLELIIGLTQKQNMNWQTREQIH